MKGSEGEDSTGKKKEICNKKQIYLNWQRMKRNVLNKKILKETKKKRKYLKSKEIIFQKGKKCEDKCN